MTQQEVKRWLQDNLSTAEVDEYIPPTSEHNDLTGLQGGSTTERYHMTAAENTALHSHSNKAYLDVIDQDLDTTEKLVKFQNLQIIEAGQTNTLNPAVYGALAVGKDNAINVNTVNTQIIGQSNTVAALNALVFGQFNNVAFGATYGLTVGRYQKSTGTGRANLIMGYAESTRNNIVDGGIASFSFQRITTAAANVTAVPNCFHSGIIASRNSNMSTGRLGTMMSCCDSVLAAAITRDYCHYMNGAVIGDINGGNTSEFEPNGFLKHNGTATPWVDIDFPMYIRTTGANVPVMTNVLGNLSMPKWSVDDYLEVESEEIIHGAKQGSIGYFHIHILTAVQDASDRYIRFEWEFNYSNVGAAWQAANIVNIPVDLLIPANTPIRTHLLFNIHTWSDIGNIGRHVKGRVKRVAAVGTAPSVDPFSEMIQLHVQCDTGGSRNITTK